MKSNLLTWLVLIMVLSNSCTSNKTAPVNYDEVLLTVKASTYQKAGNRLFVVITNNNNDLKCEEITAGATHKIIRGNDFKGDIIHVHQVEFRLNDELNNKNWYISSCFDLAVGTVIDQDGPQPWEENYLKSAQNEITIKFTGIPDYEVMTRSFYNSYNCITSGNKNEDSFPGFTITEDYNEYYVCLQSSTEGKFKLESIPLDTQGEYEISLKDMNSDMESFTYPKKLMNYELQNLWVRQFRKNNYGSIPILSLYDHKLFSEDVTLHVPNHPHLEKTFDTKLSYTDIDNPGYHYTNERYGELITEMNFFDASLRVAATSRSIPEILKSEGDFQFMEGDMIGDNIWWSFYLKDGESFHYPEFPEDVFKLEELNNHFDLYGSFNFNMVKYPEKDIEYEKFISYKLNHPFYNYVSENLKITYGYYRYIL